MEDKGVNALNSTVVAKNEPQADNLSEAEKWGTDQLPKQDAPEAGKNFVTGKK